MSNVPRKDNRSLPADGALRDDTKTDINKDNNGEHAMRNLMSILFTDFHTFFNVNRDPGQCTLDTRKNTLDPRQKGTLR